MLMSIIKKLECVYILDPLRNADKQSLHHIQNPVYQGPPFGRNSSIESVFSNQLKEEYNI